jgi:hypothetical protein
MLYLTCSDDEALRNPQTQEVVACTHLPLEHHEETWSAHPVDEGSTLERQQ